MSLWKPMPDPDGGAGKQPSLMHVMCMKALCIDGLYHTMTAVEVEYEVDGDCQRQEIGWNLT